MEYLMKFSAIIIIFYSCYKVFLERETFFEANRWFLLIGLVAAALIPFLTIPIYIEQAPISLESFEFTTSTSPQPIDESINWSQLLNITYLLGVFVFLIRFLIQTSSLIKLLSNNKNYKKEDYCYIETSASLSPFSFFKWIVYNPTQFNEIELDQILNHEKAHAQQYHSIDILITQLACILFWFNPFIWLYNKDLKQNLEFIADKTAQETANSKKSYQYTLLKKSIPSQQLLIVNNFYNSLIKKRIIMLNKSESKKTNQYKYVLVIPLLIAFVFLFNTEVIAQETIIEVVKETKPLLIIDGKESTKSVDDIDPNDIYAVSVFKDKAATDKYRDKGENGIIEITTNKYLTSTSDKNKTYIGFKTPTSTSKIAKERITVKGYEIDANNQRITHNPLLIIDGKESTKSVDDIDPNDIYAVSVFKDKAATDKYGEKGKDGVMVISTK